MRRRLLIFQVISVCCACSHSRTGRVESFWKDAETADSAASLGEIDVAQIEAPWVLKAMAFCSGEIAKSHEHPLDKLAPKHVRSCMTAMLPKVNRCENGTRMEVKMEVVIEGTGEVSSVLPVGPSALSDEAYCVARVIIREGRFPSFNRQRLIVQYPFRLSY
jgi:hypothetical protein